MPPCDRRVSVALSAALGFILVAGFSLPALAGSNNDARLALHLLPRTTKNACGRADATPPCSNIVTNGGLYPTLYYAYLLVTNGDPVGGLAGLQCGISYDGTAHSGVDIFSWNLCATLDFRSGNWPAAGGGNLITWDSNSRCQRNEPGGPGSGVMAAAGYFYVAAYSPDALQLTVRPNDGQAKVADCNSVESTLEGGGVHHVPPVLGSASFSAGGATPGYNPCGTSTGTIDCGITGADSLNALSTGNIYSAPNAPGGATFLWAVTGNATIAGSATGSSVSITAGTGGSCTIYVNVTAGGNSALCSKVATIRQPVTPECTIAGPDSASEGNPDVIFSVSATGPYNSVSWSISGNATITSGLTAPTVHVQTSDIGTFELTATLHGPGATPHSCSKTVPVVPFNCFIAGPDPVLRGSTGLEYSTGPARIGATYLWQISGNGSLAGSATGPSVLVNAGLTGAFTLTVTITRNGQAHTCTETIAIQAGSGGPGSQANAKILLHLATPTTKNQCGSRGNPTCSAVRTGGALYPTNYFAYLLVVDGNAQAGVGGLQCGIAYDAPPNSGVDVFGWSLCASLEFNSNGPNGPWPSAGSGNLITWETNTLCQRFEPGGPGVGVTANAGYFYCAAYTPGILHVIPRPVDGQAKVADCSAYESLIGGVGFPGGTASHLGAVYFSASGNISGYNPCGAVYPVRITSWSSIKAMYGPPDTERPEKP